MFYDVLLRGERRIKFQHHPDGLIFIRIDDGIYMDLIANFEFDFGESYPGLPEGYIGKYYELEVSHYNIIQPEGPPY